MESGDQRSLRPLRRWRIGLPVLLVVAGIAAGVFYGPLGPMAPPLLFGLVACGVIVFPYSLHGGLGADAEGLTVRSLMSARRISWKQIDRVHRDDQRQAICIQYRVTLEDEVVEDRKLQFFNWYELGDDALIEWLSPTPAAD